MMTLLPITLIVYFVDQLLAFIPQLPTIYIWQYAEVPIQILATLGYFLPLDVMAFCLGIYISLETGILQFLFFKFSWRMFVKK